MNDKKANEVSYLVYESSQTRSDRIIHRLIIALLCSIGLLFVSNALWLWAWTHETTIVTEEGTTNYIGESGVINNND